MAHTLPAARLQGLTIRLLLLLLLLLLLQQRS
jgi:hypothetical protein